MVRFPPLSAPSFALCLGLPLAAQAAQKVDFHRDVRPFLSETCFYCHGQDPNHRKAGLRLDAREPALQPAESGEVAIVPGDPKKSALLERIVSSDRDELMPPPNSHRKLTEAQKETLKRWIAEGAEYQPHWAFVVPQRPAFPEVKRADWSRNGIDRYVLGKLEEHGLPPSPEADRPTLIRRVTLDLTGLPPSPEEVDAFVSDPAPDAYERLVDRLLASTHYGERMALPWLDAARYADSNGFQQDGDTFQWIWRDWVVNALNADMSFEQFSIEQIAGDLLPNATQSQKVATAFNRNHLLNGEGGAIAEEQRHNILFDRVDTTATTWMGLTLACSQCHDHKYDPLTMRDYYGFMAVFNQLPESGLAGGGGAARSRFRIAEPFLDVSSQETKARISALDAELREMEAAADVKKRMAQEREAWEAGLTAKTAGLPNGVLAILEKPEASRSEEEKKELRKALKSHFDSKVWPGIAAKLPEIKKFEDRKKQVDLIKGEEVLRVMVMQDSKPRDTFILDRGSYEKPTEKVEFAAPGFLPPLAEGLPKNRLGFARWLFAENNPLTARVQVNRMWQLFFGTGLVKTSEDLGVQSEMPVHQELLDWLAVEFRENGWSQKKMHRLIVTSATYRQTSRVTADLLRRDPENRLLGRASRFRLPSIILRDVALAASGLLDRRTGGRPVYPYQPDQIWETLAITKERDFTYPTSSGADLYRRSLYTFWRRTIGPANMFDGSNRQTCRVRTATTNTPLHALTTLNDPTWSEAARVLAAKAMQSAQNPRAQLAWAFRRVVGRNPRETDLALLDRALERQRQVYETDAAAAEALVGVGESPKADGLPPAQHAALSAVCLAMLNLDEALTRE